MPCRKFHATFLSILLSLQSAFVLASDEASERREGSSNSRIVSAGGSITEILYALGMGEQVVAVDSTSLYPPKAATRPKVGYFRSLAAEGLMSLKPDILVAANGAGPEVVLQQVQALGVVVKQYEQSTYTLDSWKALITQIGLDFGREQEAQSLIEQMLIDLKKQQHEHDASANQISAITLLSIGERGPVAAGSNTVPDMLLTLAGVDNVAHALEGYQPFSSELLVKQHVDMVLVPSHVVASLGGREAICDNKIVKMATAAQCNLVIMDPLLLMGFGTRLDQAVGEIRKYAGGV